MDKVKLIEALAVRLFEPEYRRLGLVVEQLDKANREIKGHSRHGFMHAGRVFVPPNSPYKQEKSGYETLAFSLTAAGTIFLKDKAYVEDDQQYIKQITHLLIADCETIEDIRNALPESLVELSPKLSAMPRTNEAAYTISHDPRKLKQYQQLLDKIDFYVATRMIY